MTDFCGGVGFFDSGAGGLTVLKDCLLLLAERGIFPPIYYYGDNTRAPYGNLPPETVVSYAEEAFDEFERLKVRAAVIACNTVTALCAERFRKKYSFPIVGAEPAVFSAAKTIAMKGGGNIYVLATCATANSDRFRSLCARAIHTYPKTKICVFGNERLAGEVERHLFDLSATDFSPLFPKGKPDGVVLGCTHYVFLREQIKNFYSCPIFDGNEGIAHRLSGVLQEGGEYTPFLPTFDENPKDLRKNSPTNFIYLYKQNGGLSVYNENFSEKSKKNEKGENRRKIPEKGGFFQVFFLGSGKIGNKMLCEQMFEYKNRRKE